MPSQSETGESSRIGINCASMANTTMVPSVNVDDTLTTLAPTEHNNPAAKTKQPGLSSTTPGIVETRRMACIRSSLQNQGISKEAEEVIIAS